LHDRVEWGLFSDQHVGFDWVQQDQRVDRTNRGPIGFIGPTSTQQTRSDRTPSAIEMARAVHQNPVTIERLERALVLLAYFIELDGDVHLAMYERFEAELAELKAKQDTKTRANQILQRYLSDGGGIKAIR